MQQTTTAKAHLAPLLGRETPLPRRFAARTATWTQAADMLAERLTDALGIETSACGVALGIKSAIQVRTRTDVVVVPLSEGFLVISTADTRRLANRLLRAEPVPETDDEGAAPSPPAALDVLLMRGIAAEACVSVAAAFGTTLTPSSRPRIGWPPAAPEAAPFLCAAMPFEAGGAQVILRLLLDGPPDAYAAEAEAVPVPCPQLAEAAKDATAPVSAVLDSWTTTAAEAAGLRAGATLPLPGASVEALDIVIALPGGPMRVASAELGKARGRQAVRLTSALGLG